MVAQIVDQIQSVRTGRKEQFIPKTGGTGKNKKKNLRYPSEFIDSDQDHIKFTIIKYERGSKEIRGITATTTGKGEDAKTILTDQAQQSKLVGGPKKLLTNPLGTILLPIPQAISDTNATNYGESKLNDFYAGGINAVEGAITADGMKGFMGALAQGGKELTSSLTNPATKNALNSWIAAKAVGVAGADISPEQLMMRQSAQVINPNMEMLFSGPSVRTFQFLFKFTPRTQNESSEVKNIIRSFKQNMMPIFDKESSFLKAPNIFQLQYMKGAAKHPYLNQFKLCALTNCATTYTGDGTYATYHDGTPISMTMNLSFQELTPVYNEDYDNEDGAIGVGY